MSLKEQLEALDRIETAGPAFLSPAQISEARDLAERAKTRRRLSPEITVIGLLGATGSGKSSLMNALMGAEVSAPGVRRPTTKEITAATGDLPRSAPILEWLGVSRTWQSEDQWSRRLVLLDLPDFDSIASAHREIASRLAGQVDVLVWVVDPQKYADRVIHQDYLQPLSHQGSVTLVVLNQVDRLTPSEQDQVQQSLANLLTADGLAQVPIFPVSALEGVGIAELRRELEMISATQNAAETRLRADIGNWAYATAPIWPADARIPPKTPPSGRLTKQVGSAAGIDGLAKTAGRAYRKRARQSTGWMLTSWVGRLRPDPLRRLGIEQKTDFPSRTSLPALSPASDANLSAAVRDYAREAAELLPTTWRAPVVTAGGAAARDLREELDKNFGSVDYRAGRSWWWPIFTVLQWLSLLAVLTGLGWYLAAWGTAALGLPLIPISKYEGWPVPGMLVAAGLLAGILFGLASGFTAQMVAAGRARSVRKALSTRVNEAVQKTVVTPISAQLEAAGTLELALEEAAQNS